MTKIDKSGWENGPWSREPDQCEFRRGTLYGNVTRNPMGFLCGYVGVPPGHTWHGKDEDDIDAECHYGLTYSRGWVDKIDYHLPESYWLVGFDCGHTGDLIPCTTTKLSYFSLPTDVYRDFTYVLGQVFDLFVQAGEIGKDEIGLNVTDGVSRFGEKYIIPREGGGLVRDYIRNLVPLEIVADWITDNRDEIGFPSEDDVWSLVTGAST